jgi:carboxypeptidase Taq
VLARVGFDFAAGRIDESAHPFTGGVPEDVRLTTRYCEDDYLPALRSTLHEAGHARYAQGLPRAWLDQPLGRPRSFGIHESQSLFVEKQIGRSRAFAEVLAPLVHEHLGARASPGPAQLYRRLTRVAPGPIRVNADEASYPLHIIVRYEIERALIGAEIEPEDVPVLWDERMAALLGVDTRGDLSNGCLQDVHWADGKFGYFPSYALGALYAAQWRACLATTVPDLDAQIAAGELAAAFDWLDEHIWSQASRWETAELVRRASGTALDASHFRAHLEARYVGDG